MQLLQDQVMEDREALLREYIQAIDGFTIVYYVAICDEMTGGSLSDNAALNSEIVKMRDLMQRLRQQTTDSEVLALFDVQEQVLNEIVMDNIVYDPPGTGRFRIANTVLQVAFDQVWEILDQVEIIEQNYDAEGAEIVARSQWFPCSDEIIDYVVALDFERKCLIPVGDVGKYVQEMFRTRE